MLRVSRVSSSMDPLPLLRTGHPATRMIPRLNRILPSLRAVRPLWPGALMTTLHICVPDSTTVSCLSSWVLAYSLSMISRTIGTVDGKLRSDLAMVTSRVPIWVVPVFHPLHSLILLGKALPVAPPVIACFILSSLLLLTLVHVQLALFTSCSTKWPVCTHER